MAWDNCRDTQWTFKKKRTSLQRFLRLVIIYCYGINATSDTKYSSTFRTRKLFYHRIATGIVHWEST